jgi:hypothetical protein
MAMISGGAIAQQSGGPQEVTFDLTAIIKGPGLEVTKRPGLEEKITTTAVTENGNPKFDKPIELTIKHPESGINVKLGNEFKLTHAVQGNVSLPMIVTFESNAITVDQSIPVALADQAKDGKNTDFKIEVANDSTAAQPGIYNGTLSLTFEVAA